MVYHQTAQTLLPQIIIPYKPNLVYQSQIPHYGMKYMIEISTHFFKNSKHFSTEDSNTQRVGTAKGTSDKGTSDKGAKK
jgi:hypothetical protein